MMNFEIPILGVAIYLLFWDKLPSWGSWFNWILVRLPSPLQTLYEQWRCAYCSGFWIGVLLHWLTGEWFIKTLNHMPSYLGEFRGIIGWTLDGLAVAFFILLFKMIVDVLKALRA